MVSSLYFSCRTVHVGVMRRSVRKPGSAFAELGLELGEVMMTAMSVGVGWNAICTPGFIFVYLSMLVLVRIWKEVG